MEEKTPTLCLVMIVKNESKVIKRCLDSVKDYLDYWVICDTGSTDGTQDLVRNYFEEKKIKGELLEHEWKNFGHNRTQAVQAAQGKADYLVLMDADFVMVVKDIEFKKSMICDNGYMIRYEGNLDYRQMLLVSGKYKWRYIGVTHEFIDCPDIPKSRRNFDGFTIHHHADGGSRSDKFERDIILLKQGLRDEPNNLRYWFYLARSYDDLGKLNEAIDAYDKRISMKGWIEEDYYARYQRATCMRRRGDSFEDVCHAFMEAYQFRSSRLEAIHDVVRMCRLKNKYKEGFRYGIRAFGTGYPSDILFVDKSIHDWKFNDELALCAYYCGHYEFSKLIYDQMFRDHKFPDYYYPRVLQNYEFFMNKTAEVTGRGKEDYHSTNIPKKKKVEIEKKSHLENKEISKIDESGQRSNNKKRRKTIFFVYYGLAQRTGGTYVTMKSYIDYFRLREHNVFEFYLHPTDEQINELKPDCIVAAQHINFDMHTKLERWGVPSVALTFARQQYKFVPGSSHPTAVTYSNNWLKEADTKQENGYVIRDPVDHTKYEVPEKEMSREFVTLIGSPPSVKGHRLFFQLADRFPFSKFLLVTDLKEFKKEMADVKVPDNLTIQPYIKELEELKTKVYARTKILLLPSVQEAFGRVTIEATSSAIPCLISDYPGLSEATFNRSNYVKDFKNVDAWTIQLRDILSRYDYFVEEARKLRGWLDYERDVSKFHDLVMKVVTRS